MVDMVDMVEACDDVVMVDSLHLFGLVCHWHRFFFLSGALLRRRPRWVIDSRLSVNKQCIGNSVREYELRFLAILAAERAESNPPALLPMPAYSSGPDKTGGEGPVVLERTVGDVVLKKAWREAIHSSSSEPEDIAIFTCQS